MDNSILYKEITDKSKFKNKDDIYDNDSNKADNYFKARGLSLEYYINCLLMIKFKQKELPRVIYHFLTDDKNNKKIKIIDLEELDGVFYLPTKEKLMINDLPFIVEDVIEIKDSNYNFEISYNDCIQFEENSLVLLEVKNRFPGTNNLDSKKDIEKI